MCWGELIISVFVALVFRRYDPNFIATSLDEAYLNITNICIERGISGEEVSLCFSHCHRFWLTSLDI
jgi:hypothetical protein